MEGLSKVAVEVSKCAYSSSGSKVVELKQDLIDFRLLRERFNYYLEGVRPLDLTRKDAEVYKTRAILPLAEPAFLLSPGKSHDGGIGSGHVSQR